VWAGFVAGIGDQRVAMLPDGVPVAKDEVVETVQERCEVVAVRRPAAAFLIETLVRVEVAESLERVHAALDSVAGESGLIRQLALLGEWVGGRPAVGEQVS
jgi:hypothetical protein